jgi:phospholipid transport system substrate-binding protein
MKRRSILAACAASCALGFVPEALRASHGEAPDAFLRSLTDRALAQLNDPSLGQTAKEANFLALLREAFDLQAIGKFVLAKHWRRASTEQRADFIATFEESQLRRFLPLFADYTPEMIEIGRARPDPNSAAVVLVWRLVDRAEAFKVVDIVAEGVSMAISLRHEYGAVAQRDGIDGLIEQMRAKNRELEAG